MCDFKKPEKSYEKLYKENYKLLRDFSLKTDNIIGARIPDMII